MNLIDVDVLNKDLDWYDLDVCGHCGNKFAAGFEAARELVALAPTIDAEPVRHGRWNPVTVPKKYGGIVILCSECDMKGTRIWNFCPSCGAKMDAEVQDGSNRVSR